VLVRSASLWELSLKHHQGKLPERNGAIDDLSGLLQADGLLAAQVALDRLVRLTAELKQTHREAQ
jgi:PIN domain nuclease of toxin-antitoxin system